jgi:acetylornithine deacetylase/succinyl-diaminopimelate desuccinylase-like protein
MRRTRGPFTLPLVAIVLPLAAIALPLGFVAPASAAGAQRQSPTDWKAIEEETLRHYQALLRFDTSDPPGNEQPAVDYLKEVLEKEGVPVQTFALEAHRPNLVARLPGSGRKRPLLMMGHTDVVNVDAKKWTFPPFSATRDGGYVYGRGSVDDKDNVVAGLMVLLMLKRSGLPLDRDVIYLAEAGEEGTVRVGIKFMVERHFADIDAEYCFAEGGNVARSAGRVKFASVQTLEKIPRAVELAARGPAGHGSVPLQTNAVVRLAKAVAAIGAWRAPIDLNETTRTYFQRLAEISTPEEATRYRNVLSRDANIAKSADDHLAAHEPRHASMLRTSVSPNILEAGYRVNVIPSEAKATLDVRMLPNQEPQQFLDELRRVIGDPHVEVRYMQRDVRPAGTARLDTEAFQVLESAVTKHYATTTLPTMSTGATDMAYLRAKGVQCYGIGPALDLEDGPKGFGAHSDQERILESELFRFVRFHYDVVAELARAQ